MLYSFRFYSLLCARVCVFAILIFFQFAYLRYFFLTFILFQCRSQFQPLFRPKKYTVHKRFRSPRIFISSPSPHVNMSTFDTEQKQKPCSFVFQRRLATAFEYTFENSFDIISLLMIKLNTASSRY